MYSHPSNKPRHLPSHTPSLSAGPLSSNLSHGSTTRRVHRPRASYTPTARRHHCWQVCASPTQPPSLSGTDPAHTGASARTGRVLRVRSAPTPSYVRFARTSYTLQQPRSTSRSLLVVLELAGTTGHPAGSAALLCCAVSGTPRCTAESSRGCGGNAHTSVLLDCRGRREKQWDW